MVFVWACVKERKGKTKKFFFNKWIARQRAGVVEGYCCVQYVNQSQNRGWEKEGEGGELRVGGPGGVGDIEGGISRVHVG